MSKTPEEEFIRRDRMRYSKNKLSSNLTLLAIVFNVLYFVSIYRSDAGSYYYTILIGGSIIYNLLFMLGAFLASEGAKNRIKGYSYVLVVLGVIQIVRIFIIPMQAHATVLNIAGADTAVMGNAQFLRLVVYMVCSAVCLVAAGVINYVRCNELQAHLKEIAEPQA